MIGLFIRVVIWVFAAFVVVGAITFLVVEAMDKVESIQKRAPWIPKLLERRDAFVALLLMCVVLLIGDGYELVTKEAPETATIPTIVFKAPLGPNLAIQSRVIKTTGSGRLDRDLNDQQSDHLYHQLKGYVDTPNRSRPVDITLVNAFPCDRESHHLFLRLSKVLTDAHWTVTQQGGWPVKSPILQGRAQNEIPIGIWVITDDGYLRYLIWNSLRESGLESDERFVNELPSSFKGLIVVIGYKDAPF